MTREAVLVLDMAKDSIAPEAVEGLIESGGRLESLPRLDPVMRSLSRPV